MDKVSRYIIIGLGIVALGLVVFSLTRGSDIGTALNSVVITEDNKVLDTAIPSESVGTEVFESNEVDNGTVDQDDEIQHESNETISMQSSRIIFQAESIVLPNSGSAPTENVKHSIPLEEIRRGCFRQDCIPSVDNPKFISISEADDILPEDTVGIALEYKGVERFYPFNMLVTREIVNDVVAGDPLLVTYCPLCGTGIVFDATVDGTSYEFGVSGMLWQSNLLMYNRASNIEDRNLWSQVLGEAVVGNKTGTKLSIVPSNIVRYVEWREDHANAEVLNTGRIGDPYGGDYYGVARSFSPNFDEANSALDPSAYVFGVEIDGQFKAYEREGLPIGNTTDSFAGETLTISKTDSGEATVTTATGDEVPIVSGFWFSWIAAHPETSLWNN